MIQSKPDLFEDSAVRLDGVGLRYESTEEVLSGVDLTLAPGSFTFLTGPSGAGKTSLLKLLYLALPPTRGEVSLFGRRTSALSRKELSAMRRRIGVVFQEFRLLEHLTAYENAALPLRVSGRLESEYRPDVEELLRWVGLGPRMDARPEQLSGGEQQRVAIARALVNKPSFLIADEPTGNVDPEMGERLLRLFVELNRRLDTTVLIATHDLTLIRKVSAPVLRLQHGLIVRDVEFGPEGVVA
ncbi:MAG: cell division ATP-binding protein FtsE [Pseudomonadota bacterium]